MKHTPGPWQINEKRDDAWEILGPDGDTIYTICELGYTGGNASANATLIAAAPELLNACIAAKAVLASHYGEGATLMILNAAIAKAEGRADSDI